jgi:hypothetical protein
MAPKSKPFDNVLAVVLTSVVLVVVALWVMLMLPDDQAKPDFNEELAASDTTDWNAHIDSVVVEPDSLNESVVVLLADTIIETTRFDTLEQHYPEIKEGWLYYDWPRRISSYAYERKKNADHLVWSKTQESPNWSLIYKETEDQLEASLVNRESGKLYLLRLRSSEYYIYWNDTQLEQSMRSPLVIWDGEPIEGETTLLQFMELLKQVEPYSSDGVRRDKLVKLIQKWTD